LKAAKTRTPDIGGTSSTREMGESIALHLSN
jgi:isocitrate/isopropylmalate dehydrogenase